MKIDEVKIGELYRQKYTSHPVRAEAIEKTAERQRWGYTTGRQVRMVRYVLLNSETLEPAEHQPEHPYVAARELSETWDVHLERTKAEREARATDDELEGRLTAALDHAVGWRQGERNSWVSAASARKMGFPVTIRLSVDKAEKLIEVLNASP